MCFVSRHIQPLTGVFVCLLSKNTCCSEIYAKYIQKEGDGKSINGCSSKRKGDRKTDRNFIYTVVNIYIYITPEYHNNSSLTVKYMQ